MQLAKAKEGLTKAEAAMRKVQQETGILKLDDQAKPIFDAMATIRGLIASKEVEIEGMKSFATEKNADLILARQVLAGMQKQLALLQKNDVVGNGDILVPTGRIPELGLEYLRRLRELTYYETLYQALAKQYETARIDAGKTATVIQSVDKAIVLDKKTKPVRSLIVIISAFVAGVLAVLAAFVMDKLEQFRQDPAGGEKMRLLRELAKWKRA
jgi:capsule polysaccharide export protein KpsE/RkpR